MQEPIRYYITKRGEEPTVRSVKVAQSVPEDEDAVAPTNAVERLVKGAIRGRSSQR